MMKKLKINNVKVAIFTSLLLLVIFFVMSCSTSETQTVANFTTITMQDEFDVNGAPDSSIWSYDIGTGVNGWGNNELQYYTDRSNNVNVQNGYLIITADRENYEGSEYTSGRLLTKIDPETGNGFEQKYGRFEARIQLPWGQGLWPAFWMLGANIDEVGWPQCGEIDIMEYRGQEPTLTHGSIHGPGYSGATPVTKSYDLGNDRFDTGFHIFGIEWGPDYINYYVDDVLYNQITPDDASGEWVFDKPFFIIMNVAVGGNFLGNPTEETVFPQSMLVDYVRVYQANHLINN